MKKKTNYTLDKLTITVIAEDSVMYESSYLGQHGISLLLKTERKGLIKNILVDVAQNPGALLENMEKMQISPDCIDMIVLTHCHYDHTQGLARILKEMNKKDVPVIAHPDIFRLNFVAEPSLRHVGVMDGDKREDIEEAGGLLYLTKDSIKAMPGLITTGEVERVTDFEDVGMSLFTIENGQCTEDKMLDDISVIANIEDKGIVIITGCSHAGIVNICMQSMKLTGTKKIHGIVGGFHLVEASDSRIKETSQVLKKLGPDWICPGHCTGFRAQA
ncbi:MAG: MBL fold metallo-hydrolase, partial [Thermodesulfobacteriota bacterium]|nr:MBL fold metallo-hydrolase [Thermodesulfobacteriota bacterium]